MPILTCVGGSGVLRVLSFIALSKGTSAARAFRGAYRERWTMISPAFPPILLRITSKYEFARAFPRGACASRAFSYHEAPPTPTACHVAPHACYIIILGWKDRISNHS